MATRVPHKSYLLITSRRASLMTQPMANERMLTKIQSKDFVPAEAMLAPARSPAAIQEKGFEEKSLEATPQDDVPTLGSETEWSYPDGGTRAWLVVFGCFLYACTSMSFGLVWGVLQDYYHTNMFPDTSLSVLSLAGGLQNFLMNCTAYLSGGLGDRYGYKRIIAISSLLSYLSLLASAFSTKLSHVFLFQGAFLGVSQGLGYPLYVSMPSQWFLEKRGLATGLAICGSGIGGGVGSLIVRLLLSSVGYRNTMLIYSSMNAVSWTIAWFLLKERLRPGQTTEKKRWLPEHITGEFYSIALSVFVGIFGFLSPFYFISTYTKQFVPSIDPKSLKVTLPLVLMNFSAGFGRILAGQLADIIGPINAFFSSFFFGGLIQMLVWTFAKNFPAILVFSILNGLIACWFMSLLPVVCAKLFGIRGLSTITGFMILANSPGQLAGAPIGGAVFAASGNNWVAVTMYSGGLMLTGSLFVLYARFSYDKRLWARV